jgi:hypothetical protein
MKITPSTTPAVSLAAPKLKLRSGLRAGYKDPEYKDPENPLG